MNTSIIQEVVCIRKEMSTVQLRISAVLLRKTGRWTTLYADGFAYYTLTGKDPNFTVDKLVYVNSTNVYESKDEGRTWYDITPPKTSTP